MKRATQQMRSLAMRLIAYDAAESESSQVNYADVFQVCEKLRPQLATLVGSEAFRALLAHALALACAEVPSLHAAHVKTDGMLEMSEEIHAQGKADKFFEGRIVLVAHLLGLLVAFIGEDLTLQLVSESWPELRVRNLDLDGGHTNETKK